MKLFCVSISSLCECERPLGFTAPITSPTSTTERELSFANAVGQLDSRDRDGRVLERLEASHRRTASLDRPMILLNQVVEIFIRPHFDVPPARVFTSQQPQRATTRHVSVECHFARDARKGRGERLAKERLCGPDAAVAAKQEVDDLTVFVDCPVQVVPFRFDRDAGFIDAPRGTNGLGESVPPPLKLRHVARHPSKDRRMGDLDAALGHHLDQIPIRQAIRYVPTYAQLDNVRVEGASTVDWITGDRLGHSTPRKTNREFYRMSRDAPEPGFDGGEYKAHRERFLLQILHHALLVLLFKVVLTLIDIRSAFGHQRRSSVPVYAPSRVSLWPFGGEPPDAGDRRRAPSGFCRRRARPCARPAPSDWQCAYWRRRAPCRRRFSSPGTGRARKRSV